MKTALKTASIAATAIAGLLGTAHAAHMAFTLGDNGNTLVRFAPDATGFVGVALSGDAATLDTVTYRPETGQLYGYSSDSDAFYIVDPLSGATSLVASSPFDVTTDVVGLDFNPTLDAVRLVSVAGDNIVYFPGDSRTGANAGVITDAPVDLFYDEGYSDALVGPNVIGNAYTNQVGFDQANMTGTTQYVLDSQTDTLGILNNNDGDIDFVADITLMGTDEGIDFGSVGGFDIFTSPEGENIAYALLTTVGGTGFYGIDLGTGIAELIGMTTTQFGVLQGLAVYVPDADVIPIPAAGLLFLTGAGGLAAARRRKKARA